VRPRGSSSRGLGCEMTSTSGWSDCEKVKNCTQLYASAKLLVHKIYLVSGPPHACACIFIDNSGVDVVLGVLPFVEEMLAAGTRVLLCANHNPGKLTCDEHQSTMSANSFK